MTAQAQVFFLTIGKSFIVALIILGIGLLALRLWRGGVQRLAARALASADNLARERQLKIQTLAGVSAATGTIVIGLVTGMMVLNQFTDVAPLLAGVGVVGLALGLGAQSIIRDVINGFFILLEDHFGVGDVVKINDQYSGSVEHLDLRRTVLRTLEGWQVSVPNGEIRVVANMTREWSREVVDLEVAYHEDVDRVTRVLETINDEALADPDIGPALLGRPEVQGIVALGEARFTIRVLLKTPPIRQWETGRRYRALVKKVFERDHVSIPYPHRVVIVRGDHNGTGAEPEPELSSLSKR